MDHRAQNQHSALFFRIGRLYAEMVFWAESAWTSDRNRGESAPATINFAIACVELCNAIDSAEIDGIPKVREAVDSFASAVNRFAAVMRKELESEAHYKALDEYVRRCDPENQHAQDFVLLQTSPFFEREGKELKAAKSLLQDVLAKEAKICHACLQLALLLIGESLPTFIERQMTRTETNRGVFYATEFPQLLKEHLAPLRKEYAFLADHKFDYSNWKSTGLTVFRELASQIEAALREPLLRSGYLGLVFDRSKGRVRRQGFGEIVISARTMQWDLLSLLEESGENFCPRSELAKVWANHGRYDVSEQDERLTSTLGTLKTKLRRLGLRIHTQKLTGSRLEDDPQRLGGPHAVVRKRKAAVPTHRTSTR